MMINNEELAKRGIGNKMVIVGGVIPYKDIAGLKERGVKEVFRPGSSIKGIVSYIENEIPKKKDK